MPFKKIVNDPRVLFFRNKLVTSQNVSFPKLFYVKYFFANDGDKNRGGDTISHPVYQGLLKQRGTTRRRNEEQFQLNKYPTHRDTFLYSPYLLLHRCNPASQSRLLFFFLATPSHATPQSPFFLPFLLRCLLLLLLLLPPPSSSAPVNSFCARATRKKRELS